LIFFFFFSFSSFSSSPFFSLSSFSLFFIWGERERNENDRCVRGWVEGAHSASKYLHFVLTYRVKGMREGKLTRTELCWISDLADDPMRRRTFRSIMKLENLILEKLVWHWGPWSLSLSSGW
jgi:hypothetical protein